MSLVCPMRTAMAIKVPFPTVSTGSMLRLSTADTYSTSARGSFSISALTASVTVFEDFYPSDAISSAILSDQYSTAAAFLSSALR